MHTRTHETMKRNAMWGCWEVCGYCNWNTLQNRWFLRRFVIKEGEWVCCTLIGGCSGILRRREKSGHGKETPFPSTTWVPPLSFPVIHVPSLERWHSASRSISSKEKRKGMNNGQGERERMWWVAWALGLGKAGPNLGNWESLGRELWKFQFADFQMITTGPYILGTRCILEFRTMQN